VYARRKDIYIMRCMGATDPFIRLPFVIEGMVVGFSGAVASYACLNALYAVFADKVNESLLREGMTLFSLMDAKDSPVSVMALYLLAGAFIGFVGSFLSIGRHLRD
ncbi:MAG: FtsX-like permease family protein, partial [Oscillospiraceae bacterium]|nr:FtsX-like permease family protein [Oscillospiraceae bacterium]